MKTVSAAATAGMWVGLERLLGQGTGAPWQAAAITGVIVMAVAMTALLGLRETYGVDLDYEEV